MVLLLGGILAVRAQTTDYTTRVPVGTLQMFVVDIPDISTGWIPADGRALDPLDFPELYDMLGCYYGCEDLNFRVPNLISRVPVGAGADCAPPCLTGRDLGEFWGDETHTLTVGELPAHNHGVTDPGHVHTIRIGTGAGLTGLAVGTTTISNPTANRDALNSATTGISIQNTGGGGAFNMWQPSLAVNFAIWGGIPAAPADDIVITVVVVFPTHTLTPTPTPTLTPTTGPSPTPTATATATGAPGHQTSYTVGGQEVLMDYTVRPGDGFIGGTLFFIAGLLLICMIWYVKRKAA